MAKITFDLKELKAFNKKLETAAKDARQSIAEDCLNVMAAEYVRVAKLNTPVGGSKDLRVSEGNYKAISKNKRSNVLARKSGKEFRILTPSEHMRRSWQMGNVVNKGNEHSISVHNSASYASFVNDGHRQTPGRYVPVLGKRLVNSWVDGLYMAEKAEKSVLKKGNRIISMISREHLEKGLK